MIAGPVDAAEFAELYRRCSNWGRWGSQDQRGALNHITPAAVAAASALVRSGVTVSCARVLDMVTAVDNPHPGLLEMTGLPGPAGATFASDSLAIRCHGEVHSHLDALCHVGYQGRLYNGWDVATVGKVGGQVGDLESIARGIVSRGVLLDVPRWREQPWLTAGDTIGADELAAVAQSVGVAVSAGDVLLVRTGHAQRRKVHGPWDAARAKAGLHPRAMPWLKDREIAAIGFDGDGDAAPHACGDVTAPIHVLGINAMGLHFLDALDLDDLAEHCATGQRWSFQLVVAPQRVRGATGCVVNPIAIF
jgi:kynurenine formamidase